MKFTESPHCTTRGHCKSCRSSEEFRNSLMQAFDWDGECPHGYTADNLPARDLSREDLVRTTAVNKPERSGAVSREGIVVQLRLDQFATRTLSVPILRKLTGSELSVCAVLSGIRDSELSFINPCRNRFPVMLWRGVRDESAPLTYRIDPVWQQSGALNTDLLEVVLPDSIEPPAQ